MGHGHIVHLHLHAALDELGGQDVGRVLGAAVDGGVGQQHALLLGLIVGPELVLLDEVAQVPAPHEAVQGADHLDFDGCGLLQDGLDLGAVLAHDVGVVAAGLVHVVALEVHLIGKDAAVERAEGAEGVGGEEGLGGDLIAHHDLRPVHHGGHDEGELHLARGEHVALLHDLHAACGLEVEVLAQHDLDLAVADDGGFGIAAHQIAHGGGMVGLHVVDHEVVQLAAAQHVFQVLEELAADGAIHGVHHQRLFIVDEVAVVGHAGGDGIDVLKQGQAAVLAADPGDAVTDFSYAVHGFFLSPSDLARWVGFLFIDTPLAPVPNLRKGNRRRGSCRR